MESVSGKGFSTNPGRIPPGIGITLVSLERLTFTNYGQMGNGTMVTKAATMTVEKLEGTQSGFSSSLNFGGRLCSLLLNDRSSMAITGGSEGGAAKRQRLNNPVDCKLFVRVSHGPLSPADPSRTHTGHCQITGVTDSHGILQRLASVSGGPQNVKANLKLELGLVPPEKLELNFQDLPMDESFGYLAFRKGFDFPETLAQNWDNSGRITLTLKLNREALSGIHLGSLGQGELPNRKLLETAEESGDAVIVAGNGVEVRCHKAFLIVASDVFQAMFNSDMKEGRSSMVTMSDLTEEGVKALLDYLYCCDLKMPLKSSQTALELLRVAEKYGIDRLFGVMKGLILDMDYEWFDVVTAVELFNLVRIKEGAGDFEELGRKAKAVLKSKRTDELRECTEFREQFEDPEIGLEMCLSLMKND